MVVHLLESRDMYDTGFTTIPNSIVMDSNLSPLAKVAYLALASYAWQSGECWPSQMSLAERAGLSKRHLVRCLDELEGAAYIERVAGQGHGTTHYRLLSAQETPPDRLLRPAILPQETDNTEHTGDDCQTPRQGGDVTQSSSSATQSPLEAPQTPSGDPQSPVWCHTGTQRILIEEDSIKKNSSSVPGHGLSLAQKVAIALQCDGNEEAEDLVETAVTRFSADDDLARSCKAGSRENWRALSKTQRAARFFNFMERRQAKIEEASPQRIAPTPIPINRPTTQLPHRPIIDKDNEPWMKVVTSVANAYTAQKGKPCERYPEEFSLLACSPTDSASSKGQLVLVTNEPPLVADRLQRAAIWHLRGTKYADLWVTVQSTQGAP